MSDNEQQRMAFVSMLASDLGVQHDAVLTEAKHLCELHHQVSRPGVIAEMHCDPSILKQNRTEKATLLKSETNLRSTLTPFYLELFNAIARLDGGIKFLVDLRGDLLVSSM